MELHPVALGQALILIATANGAPVFAKKLMGSIWAKALDGGLKLRDGEPLFGSSKTVRGIVSAICVTTLVSILLGLGIVTGAMAGSSAMFGDLFSSFTKRRLKLPPSSMAPGLDQIPEALLPLIICMQRLHLTAADVALGVLIFWGGEIVLSRWLHRLKIRDRPY